jgi:glycosyltransferase involved in cell wall biosynthesis
MQVCHLTSAHQRYDVRIFTKECTSLVNAGYSVCLLVADGRGDETKNGVSIEDIGHSPKSRFKRIATASHSFFKKCLEVDADLYHLHDPELIPCGLKLKRIGKKVVYDIHEDVPRQLLSKPYLIPAALRTLAFIFECYENHAIAHFDSLIAATSQIRSRFEKLHPLVVDINNYPILNEFSQDASQPWSGKKRQVCYVGGLSLIRGLNEMIEAARLITDGTILLAGNFESQTLLERFNHHRLQNLKYIGFVDRHQVAQIMKESMAGLALFHPAPNHLHAQPNKLFEYMSAGIPVIASAFPSWDSLIRGMDCGILVDPQNPSEIARAIEWIFSNPVKAESKGCNARRAVEQKYNWRSEEKKLVETYCHLEH